MLGDSKTKRHSYDVIAELLALDLLYSQNKSIIWTAAQAGSMKLSQIPLVSRLSQP